MKVELSDKQAKIITDMINNKNSLEDRLNIINLELSNMLNLLIEDDINNIEKIEIFDNYIVYSKLD